MRGKKKIFKCEICGKEEKDELDLTIYHRGCRLFRLFERDRKLEKKLGFPKGIIALDISKTKDPELQKIMDKSKKRGKKGARR